MRLDATETCARRTATRYLEDLARVLTTVPGEALERAIELLLEARDRGRRVYVMGNGGSAATATHLASDLMKTAQVAGLEPLRVLALTDNTSLLTAWANDTAYERIYAEQVAALVDPGDVVIAISASGNSPNIVAGVMAAAAKGARTIGLLGFDGGESRALVDIAIHTPCHNYGLVEDSHSAIGHAMTAAIRSALESRALGPCGAARLD